MEASRTSVPSAPKSPLAVSEAKPLRDLGLVVAFLGLLVGCADGDHPKASSSGFEPPPQVGSCATPAQGCPCSTEGAVAECGEVVKEVSGAIWCEKGQRVCDGSRWGACVLESGLQQKSATVPSSPGLRSLALGSAGPCDNPCDPYCQVFDDDPEDLDPGPGLLIDDEGITLPPIPGGGNELVPCTGIRIEPPQQTLVVTDIAPNAGGLLGEYFGGIDVGAVKAIGTEGFPSSWEPSGTRLDSVVDFDWGGGSPGVSGVGADAFAVRWTGYVTPPADGDYTFYVTGDDGVRLWIDEQLVINSWWDQGPTEYASQAIELEAGLYYAIRLEYYEHGGGAVVRLGWSSPVMSQRPIPEGATLPPEPEEPFTVEPSVAEFAAFAEPEECSPGEVDAAWTVDRVDRALVDDGEVSLFAALGGDISVSAFAGEFSDTATVHVVVDAVDVRDADPGDITAFDGAASSSDTTTILYPYHQTVFPLGIKPPVVQWAPSGTASAVKLSLRYPADGSVFSWAKIMNEPSPARYAIPEAVWDALEQTAKGQDVTLGLQRVVSGSLRPEKTKTLRFATAPLRGSIYYTEYDRGGHSSSIMRADPGSNVTATSVFSAGSGCPVCHTVSANGTMFATSDRGWSPNGGLARIESNGTFTLLSDFVTENRGNYQTNAQDWRGFAWAPITPDGKFVFAASNIWGNTRQQVVGIDETTRTVSVPDYILSGGNGTGLLARYFTNTDLSGNQWLRTDPRVDFNWGNSSPGGFVPGNFSARWQGEVQAYTSETYTFEIQTIDGVRLWVDGMQLINQWNNTNNNTYSGSIALTAGEKVPIRIDYRDTGSGSSNASIRLYWSSPSVPRQIVPQSQLSHDFFGDHFLVAQYWDNDNLSGLVLTRTEPRINADWGGSSPHPSIAADTWSSRWRGRLQAPMAGRLYLCARSDDGVRVWLNGTQYINNWNGTYNGCATSYLTISSAAANDTWYDLVVEHRENTGNASLFLEWRMTNASGTEIMARDVVPRERLAPPSDYTVPANGVRATYYDNLEFNRTIGQNATVAAMTRIEPNLNLDWGALRPNFGELTSNDDWTMRATGLLRADCTGVHEFEVFGDDGGTLWLNDQRVVNLWAYGTRQGSMYLVEDELYDLKFEFKENGGDAATQVRWKPTCNGATTFSVIPSSNLYPDGDGGVAGFVRAGGDNGNESSYWAWETPTMPGQLPRDATGDSPGRWNLGSNVLMVPTFSPNGTKLAFIDGDSGGGAGWRKGLSVMSFDQDEKLFRDRRLLVSTWPLGDAMKWPTFESDSRSLIYQRTTPGDFCCRNAWTQYGHMAPTNYYEDPGHLWSIDAEAATPVPAELKRLNEGDVGSHNRAVDHNKAYQPTMLPQPAGGYRWVVFTSTRPYGNVLNTTGQGDYSNPSSFAPMLNFQDVQSMLWVSAIDDVPSSGTTDRSHPAFWLPNQNYSSTSSGGFVNERAYWVAESCRPIGTGSDSLCEVDEDCCGGTGSNPTARCRVDSPPTIPVTRHCAAVLPPNSCLDVGEECSADGECCFNRPCLNGVCAEPPAFDTYVPANFSRIFEGSCSDVDQYPTWTFFEYQALTPEPNSRIEFYAESTDDPDDFHELPVYPDPVDIPSVALLGVAQPPQADGWQTLTVEDKLWETNGASRIYLKITARLVPTSDSKQPPTLVAWRQAYTCPFIQ